MNIFDAHISGSLSVSGSSDFSGDLNVSGIISGSFVGDGSSITNIPASGVTGLNLTQIADNSVTASISQTNGLRVNTNSEITGALKVTGTIYSNGQGLISGSSQLTGSYDQRYVLSGSITQTTWDNIANKPNDIVSGSVQVSITGTTGYETFSGSISNSINNLSSSVASDNSTQNNRLNSIESTTGSLNTFSSSIDTTIKNKLNTESVISGSVQVLITGTTGYSTFSSSISDSFNGLSSSVVSTTNALSSSITSTINSLSSSIGLTTNGLSSSITDTSSSISTSIGLISSSITSTINSLSSSVSSSIGSISASIATTTFGLNTTITNTSSSISTSISDLSGSITTINNTQNNRIGSLETESGSIRTDFNSYTSSNNSTNTTQNSRLTSVESSTGSLNSFTSSINTTIKDKMNADGVLSGSITFDISTVPGFSGLTESVSGSISSSVNQLSGSLTLTVTNLSSSLTNTDESQNARITTIESRYATTGSNSFVGTQNITGSLIISQNLTVLGSSSIVYATSSQMIVEDNVIILNASTPAERFAGIQVYDSGSNGEVTASLFWDGQNNRWIYQNSSEAHYGGAMFIAGPRNTGSLGDEITLTSGRIPKSIGGDHIGDSIISEFSGSIAISGSLIVTGSILSLGTSLVSGSSQISFNGITDKPTLVSGSSQIDHNSTTNYVANQHIDHTTISISAGDGLSGGGTIASNRTISLDTASSTFTTGVKSKLNADGVISGSSQVSFNGISDKPTLVSGSSQIDHNATTNYDSNKHIDHTAVSITAGSGLTGGGDISSTRTINVGAGNGITVNADDIAIDTSSATFTNGVKSKLNTEVVHSGSYLGTATTANLTENSSYLYYTDARVKTKLNAEGVFSGSAQVTGLSNSQLTNSSITIGSTSTSLGGTSTSLAGLTSITSTAFTGSLQGYATSETLATVTGRGASTTNKVTITASGTGGSPLLSLAVSNSTTFVHGQETFAANLTSGQAVINPIGVSGSTKNAGYIGYKYSGTGGSNDNLLTFGHWGADHLMTMNGQGNLVTVGTISGSTIYGTWNGAAIANNYLANSSFYVGTTSISLGRGSASQSLTGVNIDGTAGGETLATVTSRGASTSAALTLSSSALTMSSHYYTLMYSTNDTYVHFYPSGGNSTNYSAVNWRFWTTAGGTKVLRAAGDGTFTWDSSVVKTVANSSYSTTFSSVTSVTVTHNLGTKDVAVFVYDSSDNMFWPSSIVTTSTSVVTVTFASSRSGRVVVVR